MCTAMLIMASFWWQSAGDRLWVHCHGNVTGSTWQLQSAVYMMPQEEALNEWFVPFHGLSSKTVSREESRNWMESVANTVIWSDHTHRPACTFHREARIFEVRSAVLDIVPTEGGKRSGEMERREKLSGKKISQALHAYVIWGSMVFSTNLCSRVPNKQRSE